MPIPLHLLGCYTSSRQIPSDIIKVDPVRVDFNGKISMGVDWRPLTFVDCIKRSDSICYLGRWYLVLTVLLHSWNSRRILDAV